MTGEHVIYRVVGSVHGPTDYDDSIWTWSVTWRLVEEDARDVCERLRVGMQTFADWYRDVHVHAPQRYGSKSQRATEFDAWTERILVIASDKRRAVDPKVPVQIRFNRARVIEYHIEPISNDPWSVA